MIKLLKHYFKKRLHILIIVSTILVAFHFIFFNGRFIITQNRNFGYGEFETLQPNNNPILFYASIAILLVFIIPIFEFRFKMKKVPVDHFYSLPIKRNKLFLTKYIIGLVEIIIPLTVLFLYVLLRFAINDHIFNLKYYFIYYPVSLLFIVVLYSINVFAFIKCNKTIDGIINMVLYQLVFMLIYGLLLTTIYIPLIVIGKGEWINVLTIDNVSLLMPIVGFYDISSYFSSLMDREWITEYGIDFILIIVDVLVGIVGAILIALMSKNEKAENTLDISDSYFAYKVMIPLFVFGLITGGGDSLGLLYIFLIAILGYLGYVIYRRSFKIKKIDLIILGSVTVAGTLQIIFVNLCKSIFK